MKINISLDDRLAKRLDDYADANYMTRSGLVSIALTQYLNTQEMIGVIKNMSLSLSKMVNSNNISEEDRKEIEGYANMLQTMASASTI
jgi:metal-responsive CopG/Arc/MetJ family transcriptional regulator